MESQHSGTSSECHLLLDAEVIDKILVIVGITEVLLLVKSDDAFAKGCLAKIKDAATSLAELAYKRAMLGGEYAP